LLAQFWELPDFVPAVEQRHVPEFVSNETRGEAADFELRRIRPKRKAERLSLADLGNFILSQPSPRLVILNTVQSAAIVSNHLRYDLKLGLNVEFTPALLARTEQAVNELHALLGLPDISNLKSPI
jgi:hypothetical protein